MNHNTVVKIGVGPGGNSPMDYAWFRNNLAIGGPSGQTFRGGYGAGNPYAADIVEPGIHSSFDYDTVGVYDTIYVARIGNKPFAEIEKNGIERIKLNETFANIEFPYPPVPERDVQDLRPRKDSRVVEAGLVIPNINDSFIGKGWISGLMKQGRDCRIMARGSRISKAL